MFLPQPERRMEIQFYFGKGMAYNVRLLLAFVLLAGGIAIQMLPLGMLQWTGYAFVLAGVLLLLTRGYQNKPEQQASSAQWRPSGRAEIQRIVAINKQQRTWDSDAVDISNPKGFLLLVLLLAGTIGAWIMIAYSGGSMAAEQTARLFVNVPLVLLPFWVTGTRSILKNDKLAVKAELLIKIENYYTSMGAAEGEAFQFQILTSKAAGDAGDVPADVKALVLFREAPPSFLGLQMQVSINSVQGNDYPYFYCVLVARKEFGGLAVDSPPPTAQATGFTGWLQSLSQKPAIMVEPEAQKDVDVVVCRQQTTKNSGYATNDTVAASIFSFALGQARKIARRPNQQP